MPKYIDLFREHNKNTPHKKLVDTYYELLNQIIEDKKSKEYKKMLLKCEMSLSLIEPLIIETKREFGKFDLTSIPAIEIGANFWSVLNGDKNLTILDEIIDFFPELKPWKETAEKADLMKDLSTKIYAYVKNNNGCIQKDLKEKLKINDGKIISNTIYYMELLNLIKREKEGNSYKLFAQ
jgi:hypothetical protein